MKKTFWSFFEEKTNCTEDCNALTIKNRTQTGTFAREGLDQDHANNALGEQATLRNGPLTKSASREESDQDASAMNFSFQNIPKTITEARDDSDSALSQILQIAWGKKKSTICTSTEAIEEEHARTSNFWTKCINTQTMVHEK